MTGNQASPTSCNFLPPNWKEQSKNSWGNRLELEIRSALRMFVSTSDNADFVANAAVKGHPLSPERALLTGTREKCKSRELVNTCYDAVMVWLFMSGLVSLRWLLKYRNANTKQTLTDAFGEGRVIWSGPFGAGQSLRPLPRGHILHIFERDQPGSWRGHWMVSTGHGRAAGCNNNDEDPPVPRNYCPQLTVDKQFLDYGGGTAVVINPAEIPGRN